MVLECVKAVRSIFVLVYRPVECIWQFTDHSTVKFRLIMRDKVLSEILNTNAIQAQI